MRAIAEPKYDMRIVAQTGCEANAENKPNKNMITAFKTATLGLGVAITFYVDFLNSNMGEGGVLKW